VCGRVFIASGREGRNRKNRRFADLRGEIYALGRIRARFHCRNMSEHTYKLIELVGSSPKGIEAAVENAIKRAGKTLRNLRWFEVTETRGHIENGAIAHWQVTVKAGFTLDE